MKKILIEIGCEELPAIPFLKELKNIKSKMQNALESAAINAKDLEFFYTPRRFVFCFLANEFSDEKIEEFIGAPKQIAYKDGVLSKAGESFLAKANCSESEVEFRDFKGKTCMYFARKIAGENIKNLLNQAINDFVKSLNFGKSMRWGANDFSFIRPITNLCVMMDDELVNAEIFGIKSAKSCFVHRNVSMEKIAFNTQEDYFKTLKDGKVILDPFTRREIILAELKNIEKLHGVSIELDKELLDEVVAITEYPAAVYGEFDKEFLQVAPEVIITSMKENQRYFAVLNKNALSNHFVAISNSFSPDLELIKKGNEKVLKARLSDALFFWKNDLKTGLNPATLGSTVYMQGLGSILDKCQREEKIALKLAKFFAYKNEDFIKEAISLSKADLRTQMVAEFPELQGIIGSYYAKHMGKDDEICTAIKEQYFYDEMPTTTLSAIVSLAGKFDSLMGLFSLGKVPTGNKDPYALRRAALSLIKVVNHFKIHFNLEQFLDEISPLYAQFDKKGLLSFIYERFNAITEANTSFVSAVIEANKNADLLHINESINALISLANDEKFAEKLSTFKRLANILKDCKKLYCDETKLSTSSEKKLFAEYKKIEFCEDIKSNLEQIFALKPFIDDFFENVMINVDDVELKNNRLALIYMIYEHIASVADLKNVSF